MCSVLRRHFSRTLIRPFLTNNSSKAFSNVCYSHHLPSVPVLSTSSPHLIRYKSKKSEKKPERTESETEESTWDDQVVDKNTKVMQLSVKSPRIDGILKSALGIARNKIETLFYESKIRVNGQKLLKKSELAAEGDEIDVVRGTNINNPNFLTVARVEVLGIKGKGENFTVKARRCKNLTIEKYGDDSASQM